MPFDERTTRRILLHLEQRLVLMQARLSHLNAKLLCIQEILMAGVQELNEKIDAMNTAVADLGSALTGAVERVQEDIEFLKNQVQPDLQPQVDRLMASTAMIRDVADALNSLDPIPPVPDPEPTPEG